MRDPSSTVTAAYGKTLACPLEKDEFVTVLHLLQDLLSVETASDFRGWASGPLQALLPHGMMIAGIATIAAPAIQIRKVIVDNWPMSYFALLKRADGGFHSPIMARWHQRKTPQLYDPTILDDVASGLWSDVFFDYKLGNIAAHGVLDASGAYASYFNFSQIPETLSDRHGYLLGLLTPHMHGALARALLTVAPFPGGCEDIVQLTKRELVVLYWIREGKTNWEIAQICQRSQHTIKNQVENLFRKLQVSNRAQAGNKAALLNIHIDRPDAPD